MRKKKKEKKTYRFRQPRQNFPPFPRINCVYRERKKKKINASDLASRVHFQYTFKHVGMYKCKLFLRNNFCI